jgi:hypothetical protein
MWRLQLRLPREKTPMEEEEDWRGWCPNDVAQQPSESGFNRAGAMWSLLYTPD